MKTVFKSIGAGVAGIVVGSVLSYATDFVLRSAGVLPKDNFYVAVWLIWIVLIYRTVFNILGFYVVARLAPNHPMAHALVLGVIGTLVSLAGAFAPQTKNLGPMWYPITLAILTMPAAWFGGWLFVRHRKATT